MANDREQEEPTALSPAELMDGALPFATKAELDIQVATAKKYPRNLDKFRKEVQDLATIDEETAGTMWYLLPRDNKRIEGPSVRLAECVAYSWQNLRAGARIVGESDRIVTALGVAFDLERNVAAGFEVSRRIVGSGGRRYNDDMINTTKLAATSIAFRQAVFRLVPFSFYKHAYEASRRMALGKGDTPQQRQRAMDYFTKLGLTAEEVLQFVKRKTIAEVTEDDLHQLRGLRNAIQEGETSVDGVKHQLEAERVQEKAESAPAVVFTDAQQKELEYLSKSLGWNVAQVQFLIGQKRDAETVLEELRGEVKKRNAAATPEETKKPEPKSSGRRGGWKV